MKRLLALALLALPLAACGSEPVAQSPRGCSTSEVQAVLKEVMDDLNRAVGDTANPHTMREDIKKAKDALTVRTSLGTYDKPTAFETALARIQNRCTFTAK